jgi:hypothetical protein
MYKGLITIIFALVTSCTAQLESYRTIDPYTGMPRTYYLRDIPPSQSHILYPSYRNPNELLMEYEHPNLYRMEIY